jgi:hypothetical protein
VDTALDFQWEYSVMAKEDGVILTMGGFAGG